MCSRASTLKNGRAKTQFIISLVNSDFQYYDTQKRMFSILFIFQWPASIALDGEQDGLFYSTLEELCKSHLMTDKRGKRILENAVEWIGDVEIPGSKSSSHGNIWTYSRL